MRMIHPKKNYIGHPSKRPADEPLISFSHLSFPTDADRIDDTESVFGFPETKESQLYETGYLAKIFLRC